MLTLYENATHLIVTGEPDELDALGEAFEFRPDGYFFAPTYQRWVASSGREGWDGLIRPFKRLTSTSGRILRGFKLSVTQQIEEFGYKYSAAKLLPLPFENLTWQDVPPDCIEARFQLDDHQRQCIADWLSSGIGVNQVTVSGGKTAMFAGAAKLIKERYPQARFLYLTPSERLVRQVTKEMKKFLPAFDIGQFGGGLRELRAKDMVICTVAMLNKHFIALKAHKWFNTFIAVFYDEVHHCGSKTSQKVLLEIPAYFRLGASDSVKEDSPTRSRDILGLFGPILNRVKAAPLIQRGRIAVPHIYVVDVPAWHNRLQRVPYSPLPNSRAVILMDGRWVIGKYRGQVFEVNERGQIKTRSVKTAAWDEATQDWKCVEEPVVVQGLHRIELEGQEYEIDSRYCLLERVYDRCIIQFKERNDLIVEWTQHFSAQGYPTLVVCTRTLHVFILEALLKQALDPSLVSILFGEATPKERDATFDWFRHTPGSVLITPLVKEGVSIPEIKALVMADYTSSWEVMRQVIGRAIRKKEDDNRAHVVIFRDRQHPVLRRGCQSVLKNIKLVDGFEFYDPAPLSPQELEIPHLAQSKLL